MNLVNTYSEGKFRLRSTDNRLEVYWDNPGSLGGKRIYDVSTKELLRLTGYSNTNEMGIVTKGYSQDLAIVLFQTSETVKFFNLAGIEFGKYLNKPERFVFQIAGVTALFELSKVLNTKPEMMGMGKYILLAFGSRGQGRNDAVAHFNAWTGEINLTNFQSRRDNIASANDEYIANSKTRKKRGFFGGGSGSLAHEYGHAIDYIIQRTSNDLVKFKKPRFLSDYFHQFYDFKAIRIGHEEVIRTRKGKDGKTITFKSKKPLYRRAVTQKLDISKLKAGNSYQKLFKYMMQILEVLYLGPKKNEFTRPNKEERKKALSYLDIYRTKGSEKIKDTFEMSHYGAQMTTGNQKDYWGQCFEMWARAFEEYVRLKSKKNKLKQNLLLAKEKYDFRSVYYGFSDYSKKYKGSTFDPQSFEKDVMPLFDKFCNEYGKAIGTIVKNKTLSKTNNTLSLPKK